MGMQNNGIGTTTIFWLNETFTLLPEELRRLGYKTHMVGKWHLGHCHPGLQPLGRGFDTQYGFMLASHASYYDHMAAGPNKPYDWWNGDQIDWTAKVKHLWFYSDDRSVPRCSDFRIYEEYKNKIGHVILQQ